MHYFLSSLISYSLMLSILSEKSTNKLLSPAFIPDRCLFYFASTGNSIWPNMLTYIYFRIAFFIQKKVLIIQILVIGIFVILLRSHTKRWTTDFGVNAISTKGFYLNKPEFHIYLLLLNKNANVNNLIHIFLVFLPFSYDSF